MLGMRLFCRVLWSLLACLGEGAIPVINGSWAATIKFQSSSECEQSTAQEAFVRLPSGCNPTSTSFEETGAAWYAECDSSATWQVSWFSDLTCSVFDYAETLETPRECELNDKNQKESFYCMDQTIPVELDPTSEEGSEFWRIQTALYSASDCSDDSFFMYRYYHPGTCVAENGQGLVVEAVSSGDTTVSFASYDNDDCDGDPTSQGEIGPSVCFELSSELFMKVTSVSDQTIFGMISSDENLTTLVALVELAGLTDALKADGNLTLFAPTNAAFDAFPETAATAVVGDTVVLANILSYHALPSVVYGSDVSDGDVLEAINGDSLEVSFGAGGVSLIFPTGSALVVLGDLQASNGVVHYVDTVLLPPLPCAEASDCPDGFDCDIAVERKARRSILFGYHQADAGLCTPVA
mmetsp:Transcript_11298/g.15507  ORF Transcript_11298/g.15507 Transcript_11298/m.15507 type:complete len:410 (-) Transcript_11298:78-1307(-)|eukprot:CAMPEP_0197287598 /NCGR_PEP_ID=MMETSP0890-20130614/4155_1 /TAXON_ID=44058 ORGANISM="Aureoumbra lagunensis, Strain CCMP1510" /NCGR_SAMPLE_ID=MMETSP0890 /ASSEMBLY_ACC=CAM_ASM_000533 /LENGTH=409 /DNA_ID=CAMNT_0042757477 /DNA_START=156 /DNA_END=1385 /DNA_ORIENTATION=-